MAAARIPRVGRIRAAPKTVIHTGDPTLDEEVEEKHDLGPWVETPESSRVASFRYDFANDTLQVQWTNGRRPYLYFDVSYERYRAMVRAASKGKYIPRLGSNYQPMEGEEELVSNDKRRAPTSRAR